MDVDRIAERGIPGAASDYLTNSVISRALYLVDSRLNEKFVDGRKGDFWALPPGTCSHLVVSGFLHPQAAHEHFAWNGYHSYLYDDQFFTLHKNNDPNPDVVDDFSISWTGPHFDLMTNGTDFTVLSNSVGLGLGQILEMLNRGTIDWPTAARNMQRNGVRDLSLMSALSSLRLATPSISDGLRLAAKNIFDPRFVDKYGYNAEYPDELDKIFRWNGWDWNSHYQIGNVNPAVGQPGVAPEASWPQVFWAGHWREVGFSEVVNAYHALYGDSRFGPSPYVLDNQGNLDASLVVTDQELTDALDLDETPPFWRRRIQAYVDPPIPRLMVKQLHSLGLVDTPFVYHQFRAQGYGDQNAWLLTQMVTAKERPNIGKEACELFTLGIIDEDGYRQLLRNADFADQEVDAALQKCKYDQVFKDATATLKYIHKGRLEGSLDDPQARAALGQLGIVPKRIEDYLTQWKAEILLGERQVTLAKLMGWFVEGILTYDQLVGRLQRLNYSDKDINFLMKEAVQKQVSFQNRQKRDEQRESDREQAKQDKAIRQSQAAMDKASKAQLRQQQQQQKAQQKTLSAEQKQLQSALKSEAKALKQAQANLAKSSTDKRLIAYWKEGLITLPEIYQRLAVRGFSQLDAERWIETYLVKGVKP